MDWAIKADTDYHPAEAQLAATLRGTQDFPLKSVRHGEACRTDFSEGIVLAIYVAVSCRPAGVKPTETLHSQELHSGVEREFKWAGSTLRNQWHPLKLAILRFLRSNIQPILQQGSVDSTEIKLHLQVAVFKVGQATWFADQAMLDR